MTTQKPNSHSPQPSDIKSPNKHGDSAHDAAVHDAATHDAAVYEALPTDPCGHLNHLSDFVDGNLEPELCAKLESHLTECDNCRIVVDTLQRTVSLYRTLDKGSALSPEAEERLWRRFDLEDLLPLTRS